MTTIVLAKLNENLQRKIIQEYLFSDVVNEINALDDRIALNPPAYLQRDYFQTRHIEESGYVCIAKYFNSILIWQYSWYDVGYGWEFYHVNNGVLRHAFVYLEWFYREHEIYDGTNDHDTDTIIAFIERIAQDCNMEVGIDEVDCVPLSYTDEEMFDWILSNAKRNHNEKQEQ